MKSILSPRSPVRIVAGLAALALGATVIALSAGSDNSPAKLDAGGTNITFPVTAAFYYPWFPETWSVNGVHVKYHPTDGYYSSDDSNVIGHHMAAMQYAHVNVAITSWWGQNTHNEASRIPLLLTKAQATGVKVAFYYEKEGNANPSQAEITADLTYLQNTYGTNPGVATVNGKVVVFVYNANDTTCAIADKWKAANANVGAYIDLKVFTGYTTCASQPDSWHQYSPASAVGIQGAFMYAISPGFFRADEATARLPRDLARWKQNVSSMNTSAAKWHLITTFNEWGEGTAVEGATEWASSGGYGEYIDALHNGLTTQVPPTTTTIATTTTLSAAQVQAAAIAAPLSDQELKDLISALIVISDNRTAVTTTTVAAATTTTRPATTSTVAATTTTRPTTTTVPVTTTTRPATTTTVPATTTTRPATTTTTVPATTTTVASATQSVVVGAGDICKIATIADPTKVGAGIQAEVNKGAKVITMGDNQYEAGAYVDYQACYDKAWGGFKAQTYPAPGNHDYGTPGAAGYFQYFGTAKVGTAPLGYYTWQIDANWLGISLNDEATGTTMSNQLIWLTNVLDANPQFNVLAYMHEPVASSGQHGASARAKQLWDVMYPRGVDIVLAGHDHDYEQFGLLNAASTGVSATGIKFLVVGTGGANHYSFLSTIRPGSITRNSTTFGFEKLTLRKNDYDLAFIANSPSTFTDTYHGTIVR